MSEITLLGTFIEGLLSFLSPCVLPLIPLYMAYLSGDNKIVDEEGNIKYDKKTVLLRTVFFVLGVFLVFALLAISVNSIKEYINDYKDIISIVGSVIIFIFGLHEIGIIQISVLNKEASLMNKLHLDKMNYLKAFLFGVFFAFAWTPCIGPMLSSALLLAISQESGILYLISYALGLTIPFLITGLATSFILNLLNKYKKVLNYVLKIAGVVLVGFSIYMLINASNNIVEMKETINKQQERADSAYVYMPEGEFLDQDGKQLKFEDFNGKYVVINYVATWCTYCKEEIPYFKEFADKNKDVVCLYVMSPTVNGEEKSSIKQWALDNNVEFSILIDEYDELNRLFNISSFPTTCFIGPDQSLIGYVSGMLNAEYFDTYYQKSIEMFEAR